VLGEMEILMRSLVDQVLEDLLKLVSFRLVGLSRWALGFTACYRVNRDSAF
jgi:hypothetical protein